MNPPEPEADKSEWRAWARAERSHVDRAAVSQRIVAALGGWEEIQQDTAVLLYDPLADEPDITSLASRVRPLLTRTPERGSLTIHAFDASREQHRFGYSQPTGDALEVDPTSVDVALIPGLAFDRRGVRLGRGGGHYDRLLAKLRPDALIVGVVPAALVVERLPRESHDRRVTHLVTEDGVVRVPPMSIIDNALAWIAGDPDPVTRTEFQALVETGDESAITERMIPLEFGTAGIRGEVGAGPGRMNRAVVMRTSRGLADYLADRDRGSGLVVVGYDGRLDSRRFAEDAVAVLRGAGLRVQCFDGVTPTPLIAHAAHRLGATAAVVVTASHNPPRDNGYKVYDANGAQIVPPVDADIAAAIAKVGPASDVPSVEGFKGESPSVAEDAYVADVLAFRGKAPVVATVPIVYTAMHGVGGQLAMRLLGEAGHTDVTPVPEQFAPNGFFPTVTFPNPEEPGALDLAEALAARRGSSLVLANDPDADRLGVSVPEGVGWRRLTGNEIGVLLADFVLERTNGPDRLVINSVVSTPMLASIAAHHGASHASTLTGFKWICNAALDLESAGKRFVFGFEEALGYSVGSVVRDKDGMAAAVWFADLTSECASKGESVVDRLARLFVRDGLWVSHLLNVRREGVDGIAEISAALDRLAAAPPAEVGGIKVVATTDYSKGAELRPRWLLATPLVELSLADGSRVLTRPSGTEPKLKIYVDLRATAGSIADVPAVRADALDKARRVADDLAARMGLG